MGSDSVRSNIRALQHHSVIIQRQGGDLGVPFSIPKIKLIHWTTLKDRSDVFFAPIVINDILFPLSQAVSALATGSPLLSNLLSTFEDGWSLPRTPSLKSDSSVQLGKASPPGAIEN